MNKSLILLCTTCLALTAAIAFATEAPTPVPVPVLSGADPVITSASSSLAGAPLARAGIDTLALYGGPGSATEGKFQLDDRTTPDWGGGNLLPGGYGGDPGAWSPVDLTYMEVYWHQDTFNAENLGANGVGNHAIWSGVAAGDPVAATWANPQGYGNNWFDILLYESPPVADIGAPQLVSLDFFFNHDLEPGFDFFLVEYDSAGTWNRLYSVDGTNADSLGLFAAPGVQYSTVGPSVITYSGFDYGGPDGDQIRIRLVVESDGAWSDEDGLWPTAAGAVQVDDISLTTAQGSFTEDFEGPGPYLFVPDQAPFAGDFADVYPNFVDPDPCRAADSPVVGWIDYGQVVRNGPGVNGATQTGGSTTPGVDYGIPGNYVVNYTGGLSFGAVSVINEIWSPDIAWDLPGPEDDDPAMAGSFYRFSVYNHLPLINGIFFVWHVRSALPGEDYGNWTDRAFVYHGTNYGLWSTQQFDTTDLVDAGAERVQLALGAWDYAVIFGFPGTAATPSPIFDDVAFYKYRIGGVSMSTRNIDLAQDGFPASGSADVSTPASRDALDVPFSMARNVNTGDTVNAPGDSVIVDAVALIPATSIADLRMVWALNTNDRFEDALRAAPARAKDVSVVAGPAGTVWTGEVLSDISTTSGGSPITDRYFFDLPDLDFLYPGDVLHYYIRATDSDGRVTTLPADVTGFTDFEPTTPYERLFTVRALPTITNSVPDRPNTLVINDFGHRGGEAEFTSALRELFYYEGVHYDTYTVLGPSSLVGNGIGSAGAHGATAQQLAGYNYIFYLAGNLPTGLLSNGDGTQGGNDEGDDIGLLEAWHDLPGDRRIAYFGDNIASAVAAGSAEGLNYLTTRMGVDLFGQDVAPLIGGQTTPLVLPSTTGATWFSGQYVALGGCPSIRQFDWITPLSGAVVGHWFADSSGVPFTDPQVGTASVIFQSGDKIDITFPYSLTTVVSDPARSPGLSARANLLQGIQSLFNMPQVSCVTPCTGAPPVPRVSLSVSPNPFNPSTTVEFTAVAGTRGSVKVFNLRGELVRTLHTGEFQQQQFRWDGRDDRGASVASGVYVVRAEDGTHRQTRKVALVK